MSPRLTARHLLLVAAAALLSACSSPLAPEEAALRTDTDPASGCSGVYGGVSTRCADGTSLTGTEDATLSTESTTLSSSCSGVYGGVSTRCFTTTTTTKTGG